MKIKILCRNEKLISKNVKKKIVHWWIDTP